jgi:hypothetical protein
MSNIEFLENLVERAKTSQLTYEENLLIVELRTKLEFIQKGYEVKDDLWTALSLGIVVMKELEKIQ